MNINLTLIGQMITFIIFIWFTMKFIWPPLMRAMEARREQIAKGLADSTAGEKKLALAEIKYEEALAAAKSEAAQIVEQANHRSNRIIEQAKEQAREEGERLLALTADEIDQAKLSARADLLKEVSDLAVLGATRILKTEINEKTAANLIETMIDEVARAE